MPNDRQFQLKTQILAIRDVKDYRETIAKVVRGDDVVLEIGCEWGTTTTVLAKCAARVLATDISRECIARARSKHPELEFAVLDAFDSTCPSRPVDPVHRHLHRRFEGYRDTAPSLTCSRC